MFIFAIISLIYSTIYCVLCLCHFAFLLELDMNKYVLGTSSNYNHSNSCCFLPSEVKSIRTFIQLPTLQLHLQQKPTTIGLIRYKQFTRTKYATSLTKRLMGSSRTPGLTQENLRLTSLPIPLIKNRNVRFTQRSHFVQ